MVTTLRIARAEFLQFRRSGVLVLVGLVLTALIATSAVVAWRAERAYEAERRRYAGDVAAHWAAQPDRHPHRVAHYGYLLFRPRSPLAFFDAGVTAQTGSALFLEAHRQNSLNFAEASQADAPIRFGALTMALVLQLLVPLVLLLAAAGSVARERDEGTLAMIRAQGVSWPAILGGKTLALTAMAVALAAPAALVAGVLLGRAGTAQWTADAWQRLAALAGVHVLYFAACAGAGVVISALSRTRRDATLTLVGTWLVLWVVVPRVVPVAGDVARPLPTRAQFEAEVERRVRALGDSHDPTDENFAAFRAQTLASHGVQRVEDLPVNYNGVVMIEGERLSSEAYQDFRGVLDAIVADHARVAAAAGWVSPYVAMRLASMTLAGADPSAVLHFERAAEDYRYRLVQHLNQLHTEVVRLEDDRYAATVGATEAPTRKRIAATHWDEAPVFAYDPPALSTSAAAGWTPFAALTVWTGGLLLVAGRLRPRTF